MQADNCPLCEGNAKFSSVPENRNRWYACDTCHPFSIADEAVFWVRKDPRVASNFKELNDSLASGQMMHISIRSEPEIKNENYQLHATVEEIAPGNQP